jgi:hypothetical protein
MLISSDGNAAQALVPDAEPRFYDDIGCLSADSKAAGRETLRYVRLANGSGWIAADAARYAVTPKPTPMGHGILAFSNIAEARVVDSNGIARTWADILDEARR